MQRVAQVRQRQLILVEEVNNSYKTASAFEVSYKNALYKSAVI